MATTNVLSMTDSCPHSCEHCTSSALDRDDADSGSPYGSSNDNGTVNSINNSNESSSLPLVWELLFPLLVMLLRTLEVV